VQRKSRVFRERILSLCSVQWDLDHVWLFTQANGVLVINCETFSMVRSLSSDCIRAACCLPDCNLLFGFCNGAGHLLGVDGSVVFSSSTTGKAFEVVDHCVSVYVPAWAVIIVCSRAGLQSWRVETIGPCPQKALLPRSVPVSKNVVVPEVKEPDSPVADMVVARRKPLPKLPLSSLPDENVSIATVGSHSQENRATTSLYMSRKAMLRATLTCDEHGRIISANAAVEDIFGHDPAELIDTSCRRLFFLPRVKQRAGSILLYSARSPQRFSETDLWRSLMHDLLHVRVVNGQHKNGAHLPLLISSSELVIAGLRFYALLFEQMPKSAAILVVDGSGLVTSASDNLQAVIGWNSQHASGKTVNTLIVSPLPSTYLVKRSFDPNSIINASAKTAGGQFIAVALQVLDFGNDVYTLMVKPAERQSMSFVAEEKVEQLSHYTLGSVLGVGMCGEVREGVHKLTGTKVAVKRLKRIQCEQAGVAFSDLEVQLMKDMVHPNVIELYDCIKMEDEICLVMELVAGQELFAYCIDHAPLEEDVARKFFCDILDGVDYIHSKGIVHRDLKLENCMLINEERVKIIDFGLGNFFLRGPLHTSCGSSNYAAPELFLSKQYFGPPVDVWAMGVILFSMTTGQFPFDEVQSTIDGYYEWPESAAVSKSLQSLIREMFELNPDLRLTLQQIRRHEWVTHGNHRSVARVVDEAIRTDVVSQMETEFGMPLELVVKSVKDCATNHFTATYRILTHATASSRVQGCSVRETDEQIQAALKKIEKDGLSLDSIKRRRKSIHVGSGGIPITRASSIQSLTPRASVPSASSGARLRKNHSGLLGCNFPSVKGSEVGAAVMGGAVQQVWISKKPQVIEQAAKFTKHIKSPAHAKQVIFSSDKAAFIAIPQGQTSAFDRNRIRTPNDFEVEARIGQGGFGTIFLCKETESGLICAIKKMSKQAVLGANQVTTVNAEKEILQKSRMARSPWIVPLFYAFSDKYHLYLAMEFCGGGDLRNLMEHVSLDEDQARFLAAEIVACVHHFHERGCIHRDLKPSNFLISSSGHLRLVDFGLSKSSQHQVQESGSGGLRIFLDSGEYKTITVESKTNAWDCVNMLKWKLRLGASDPYVLRLCNTNDAERSLKIAWTILRGEDCPLLLVKARPNHRLEFVFDETGQGCKMPMTSPDGRIEARLLLTSVVGTPQYMAREMLQGVGYDATVDWWSVGCILYEMVAGVLPFSGSSAESVFNDVLSERKVDFPPTVSADARDLIGRVRVSRSSFVCSI
jgi:serine/threonine protein kinase/PAS domain-containing protein